MVTAFKIYLRFVQVLIIILSFNACGPKHIEEDLYGTWKSAKHKITIRTTSENKQYIFTSDSTCTTLKIENNNKVSGKVGSAIISDGEISANWLISSDVTGVAYTIEGVLQGRIFDNDPLEEKEFIIQIGPKYKTKDWELRYTNKGAKFPMAFMYFEKQAAP